jgi:hypothetical protein
MHICNDCRWTGATPAPFKNQTSQVEALLSLDPGEIVPSGRCPNCLGLTTPQDSAEVQIPEGYDRNASEPFAGWRWTMAVARTRHQTAIYLKDRLGGLAAEIAIDSAGERPRLEITAFHGEDVAEAESQILLSIGANGVAAFPSAEVAAQPVVYTDDGIQVLSALTRDEFLAKDQTGDFGA